MGERRRRRKFHTNGGKNKRNTPIRRDYKQNTSPSLQYLDDARISPQAALFLFEILADMNPTQAALRAGLAPNNKNNEATRKAEEMLSDALINGIFHRMVSDRAAKTLVTGDRVIHEFARIAFTDACDIFDGDWNLKPLSDIPHNARASIQSVDKTEDIVETVNPDGTITKKIKIQTKVKQHSKTDALKTLAQHLLLLGTPGNNINIDNRSVNVMPGESENRKRYQEMVRSLDGEEIKLLTKMISDDDQDIIDLESIQESAWGIQDEL